MRVRRAEDVRTRGVDRGVDHEGGGVEQSLRAGLVGEDLALVRDEEEGLGLDQGEVQPEGIHPEAVRAEGVAHGDVARDAFVETQLREDAEGLGESEFEEGAFFVLGGKGGRAGEGHGGFLGYE